MCLETIEKEGEENITQVKYGWKVFRRINGELRFDCRDEGISLPINKWMRAKIGMIYTNSWRYPKGFHFFYKKSDALDWNDWNDGETRRIKIKSIHITGYQNYRKAGVCSSIKILKKPWYRKLQETHWD